MNVRLFTFQFLAILILTSQIQQTSASTSIPEINLHLTKTKQQSNLTDTTHITRQNIINSPVIKLTDLLKQRQSIARIETNSGDNTQTTISLRGFGDNAVANSLILIDGFPLSNPSLLAPNLNAIILSDIERIDIFQGSAGTLWGDQAVGGVVNIITHHPEANYFNSKLGLGNQQTHFYSLSASHLFPYNIYTKLSGFFNQTDHYRSHNQQKNAAIFSSTGWDTTKDSIDIKLQYLRDKIDYPGGLTKEQYLTNPSQASNYSNFSNYTNQSFQLSHKHAMWSDWLFVTKLSRQLITGDGVISLPFQRQESVNLLNPSLLGKIYHFKLNLGYVAQFQDYQFSNQLTRKKSSIHQNDWYVQANSPIYYNSYFTLGSRYATQQVLVTEQGWTINPNPNWQVFIRRDGNFRFPKANEVLWHPSNSYTLKTQQGISYETGTSWHTNKHSSQLTLYRLKINNEIAFDPNQTTVTPFGSYYHLDTTQRYGISLAETMAITSHLQFNSQLNYVQARFANGRYKNKWIPAVPTWNGNIGLDYQVNDHWQVSYSTIYTGNRFASEDQENCGETIPAYLVHNLAIQYSIKMIKTSIEIANLYNQRYPTYVLYDPITHTNLYYPGAGRSFLLTFDINFMS